MRTDDLGGMDRDRLQQRAMRVLITAQILGGAGFFLGFAVAVLLAKDLTTTEGLYGLPAAVAVASAALAAAPMGSAMERAGRRPALVTGHLVGALGAICVLGAARAESFVLLCVAMAAFGVGMTSNLLSRYAAGDLPDLARRGRAISTLLLATAAGALLGPNAASIAGPIGDALQVSERAGPFAISAVALVAAAIVNFIWLRPDPLLATRSLAAAGGDPHGAQPASSAAAEDEGAKGAVDGWTRNIPRLAYVGAGSLVLANLVMIAIMTVTPLHLDDAGQSLAVVGLVLSLHFTGMFVVSPLSGALADRWGRLQLIALGGVLLLLAGGLAAPTSGHHTGVVILALVLLGVGWNMALIGGSSLIVDSVPLTGRARFQGRADLAMGMAGAIGSLSSGPLLALGGFALLGLVAVAGGLALVTLALRGGPWGRPAAEPGVA